ncbi:MAG TPA: SEFIR domain-containing protein [Candidatus Angelobacter sp.]|nr:SEFIR domain-containing protein [Candidatus Angelobacter sp.]
MRDQVFISYRHESPEHSRAVRRLGEMLRQTGLPVILDQFYLEDHPGGPDEGWPKWCDDCTTQSECVLVVGSKGWFAAYDKTEPPGQGLGAATEADLIRQALYDEQGRNERFRLTFLQSLETNKVPDRLRAWHQFRAFDDSGSREMIRWVASRVGVQVKDEPVVQWPNPVSFQPDIADRNKIEWPALVDLLAGKSGKRILLFEGGSGLGKSKLTRQSAEYARVLGVPHARIDFKGGILNTENVLDQLDLDLGKYLPDFFQEKPKKSYTLRKDLRALRQPTLLIFDSYEDAAENKEIVDWLNVQLLGDMESAPAVVVIIAGQKVPESANTNWRELTRHFLLAPITELEHWKEWVSRRFPNVKESDLDPLLRATRGQPSLMASLCEVLAKST